MKIPFLLFSILLFSLSLFAQGADKVALLVGVSNYPEGAGWGNIHGENDLVFLKETLIDRGFKEENIHLLCGKKATKRVIIESLKKLSTKVKKGGFFIFHFSGHGQQVQDLNGDENDSFDEAIVPYDAPKFSKSTTYTGENHMIDDDFAALFQPIRQQLGKDGQLLILIDACHSGTFARGVEDEIYSRGGEPPLRFPNKQTVPKNESDVNYGFFDSSGERSNLAETVLISATRASDVNIEYSAGGKFYGALSFAFCKVLKEQGTLTDYATLLSRLEEKINALHRGQLPVLEGKKNLLFGNNTLSPLADFYTVLTKRGNTATIDAGKFLKIHTGSKFVFYTSDIDTTAASRVAYGEVVKADWFYAETALQYLPGKSRNDLFKAYLTEQDFGDLELKIKLDFVNKELESTLTKRLNKIDALTLTATHYDVKLQQRDDTLELLRNGEQKVIQTHELNNKSTTGSVNLIIDKILLTYAQAQFFSALPTTDNHIKLTGRLVPLEAEMDKKYNCGNELDTLQNSDYNQQGQLKISVNTCYQIEITNSGESLAYFTIIDIDSAGDYSVMTPRKDKNRTADDYKIMPGKPVRIPFDVWGIWNPTGIEEFVILGANTAIDIKNTSRSTEKSATNNKFENLFEKNQKAFSEQTLEEESNLPPVIPSDFSVSRFFVEIVE